MRQNSVILVLISVEMLVLWSAQVASKSMGEHIRHKSMKYARIVALKEEILGRLGLDSEPAAYKLNATVHEKRNMVKAYRQSLGEPPHSLLSDPQVYAKKFYSFTDKGSEMKSEENLRLYFPVLMDTPDDHLLETVVHSAYLKLFISAIHKSDILLNVYQLLEPPESSRPRRRLLDSLSLQLDQHGWVEMDLLKAVTDWHEHPLTNHGIELSCDGFNLTEVITLVTSHSPDPADSAENMLPTLSIYTQERYLLGRNKREANLHKPFDCVKGNKETRCCRYPLWVSFREIGWDWVIAPDGFQAYYCDGDCPFRFRAAHSFSSIQSILNMLHPDVAPPLTCTATHLSPLSLLHLTDEGDMVVTQFPDMVIENCGCA